MKNSVCRYLFALLLLASWAPAQQPQNTTSPLYSTNSKWVQGMGPGYWATKGSGLTLNVAAGTVFCNGAIVTYGGGTLTMTNATTNQVYLDTASSCVPAKKTTGYTSSDIPIATVVTSGGAITSITDNRTLQVSPATGSTGTVTSVDVTFTGGLVSVAGCPVTTIGTCAFTVAGTSGGVVCFTSGTTWASSAALTNHGVILGGGAGACPGSSTAGSAGQLFVSQGASTNGSYQTIQGSGPIGVTSTGGTIAVACATCLTSPVGTTTKGGFLGGGIVAAGAADTPQPFGSATSTSRWEAPSSFYVSLPIVCINAAQPSGKVYQIAWSPQLYTGGADGAGLASAPTVVESGAAAGCKQNQASVPFSLSKGQRIRWASITGGSGTLATVSSVSAEVQGSTIVPIGTASGAQTVGTSATVYAPCFGESPTFSATENDVKSVVIGGTLQNFTLITGGTQNAGGSLVATIRDNGADTAVVMTVAAAGTAGPYPSAATAAITDGHTCSIKIQNNFAGTSTTILGLVGELLPTTAGAAMVVFSKNNPGNALTASQTRYWTAMSGGQAVQTTAALAWWGLPRGFTFDKLRCYVAGAPVTNPTTFTLYVNSTASLTITGSLTTGFSAPGVFTITATQGAAALDGITMQTITGSGTGPTVSSCTASGTTT